MQRFSQYFQLLFRNSAELAMKLSESWDTGPKSFFGIVISGNSSFCCFGKFMVKNIACGDKIVFLVSFGPSASAAEAYGFTLLIPCVFGEY